MASTALPLAFSSIAPESFNHEQLKRKVIPLGFSRDEMNLAEFPLTVLSTRTNPTIKTLEFKDSVRLKTGDVVEREWVVTAADKFGLPTATDDDVVLGLIQLTMAHGFSDRKVYFSRYELLKALQWTTEGRSYQRLTKSLDRLSGVRIKASNAFFDNSSKAFQTCNFGIIDAYEINDSRSSSKNHATEGQKSFFIWSEVIFDSFKSGYIKKLDLDLYFQLDSAVSRRLYRYLDKHFYYRSVLEKPLLQFAFEKVGLSRTYRYASSIKQQLNPALNELVKSGFIQNYEYFEKAGEHYIRLFSGSLKEAPQERPTPDDKALDANSDFSSSGHSYQFSLKSQSSRALEPTKIHPKIHQREVAHSRAEIDYKLVRMLVDRGLVKTQAEKLLLGKTSDELKQIYNILEYVDYLIAHKDPRISRSPQGFIYRAVEKPFRFVIPRTFLQRNLGTSARRPEPQRPEQQIFRSASSTNQPSAQYKDYVRLTVEKYKQQLTADELMQIRATLERKMSSLKAVLDSSHFSAAIEGCLNDELARRAQVVDLKNYSKTQQKLRTI